MPKRKVRPRMSASILNIAPSGPSSIETDRSNFPIVPSTSFSSRFVSEPNLISSSIATKLKGQLSESKLNPVSTGIDLEISGSTSNSVFTVTDLERKVLELVKYFLIADQKKIPIKKVDINKHVLKEHKTHFSDIVEKAREKLRDVFGVDLLELDDKMKGQYILVNRNQDSIMCSEDEAIKLGLLFNILAIIYMSDDLISDTELWKALRKLGVDPSVRHETFGDVKKLVLVEFVKQGYLECVKQTNSDPFSYIFHWGQRAKRELRKKDILVHVSKIYDKEPKEWGSLWQDCLAEEH